jgi:aryl-alcohol dehydrogenase-like predicted oxidoreductase
MEYRRLGNSGLRVSRIALGCMSFGDTSRGFSEWSLGDEDAQPFFQQAVELGVTFWDTANVYGFGSSEEIVGRALKKYSRREDIVLATKVRFKMHDGPGGSGLSRESIMEQIDASLARLDTDYVDLYQIHRFDPETPVEETMEALHDVVKAGKARYIGASSMWAWQFSKMQYLADLHGWTRFVPCRISTTSCNGRRSARCSACWPIKESGASRTRLLRRDGWRGRGGNTRSVSTSIQSGDASTSTATGLSSRRYTRSPRPVASRWRTSPWPGY